jgi:hypothetical protein
MLTFLNPTLEGNMNNTALKALLIVSVVAPVSVQAQGSKPTTATVIPKEDIDKVSQDEQSFPTKDENVMVVNIGSENFALGIIHRASTRGPRPAPANRNASAAAPPPCGRQMASLPTTPRPKAITSSLAAAR